MSNIPSFTGNAPSPARRFWNKADGVLITLIVAAVLLWFVPAAWAAMAPMCSRSGW